MRMTPLRGITWSWQVVAALLGLVLAVSIDGWPVLGAGAWVSASGGLRGNGGNASFVAQVGEATPSAFAYWDSSFDPARVIALAEAASVDCLGELFGGQTVRLTGPGTDSASAGEVASLQIFLVDGREGGDRLSLKVSQADGTVLYFLPLRDLETGDISVSCAS